MLVHSLPNTSVIFAFGQKYSLRFPIRSLRGKPHLGADYTKSLWQALPIGTPIIAPADCTQTRVRLDANGGDWGKFVELTTLDGKFRIIYAHLSAVEVTKVGYQWKKREVFAWSGNTGASTWPHCHVQMYMKKGTGWVLVDPEKYFGRQDPISIFELFYQVWSRPPAPGEELYFKKRYEQGSIANKADMLSKMGYWHDIVFPNGQFSPEGDNRWQQEKIKVVR
jgi:hypothetical protein